jgi:Cd(II)/Pb(II)-responsive transcriptional regulator
MRIGELATATGVDVETIRYYERQGLLEPPERQPNGYRAYGKGQLERLAFIRHCRVLDISIAEIHRLIEFIEHPRRNCSDVDLLIDEHLARVRARLKSMRALERQLSTLRRQCDTDHTDRECGILHELIAAARGEACACHGQSAAVTKPPGKATK